VGTLAITDVTMNGLSSSSINLNVTPSSGALISTLDPSFAGVGSLPFTLRVIGMNFFPQSFVTFDGIPRPTTFVSSLLVTVDVNAGDLASPRLIAVAVVNPGGITSASANLTIAAIPPAIQSLSPSSANAGDPGFVLTVIGSGFGSSSVVNVKGSPRPTTFDATTRTLSVTLTAADIATPGALPITVTDNGGTSAAISLTVIGPVITGITPTLLQNPPATVTLTVSGTGFTANSKIVFKGTARTTTLDATTGALSTVLTASDLTPGNFAVNVRNSPTALSLPAFLTILSPGQPNIDSFSPAALTTSAGTQSLTVNGINFVFGSTVNVNGSPRPTQFVSSTQLIAVLTAADVATPGTLTVTVVNPDASTSPSRTIVVSAVPQPSGPRRRGARH
jgi:trimeric autotransporter adhesin